MYLTAALFLLGVLWKVYQLAQAPQDRALRAVTACLACTAVSFSTGLPAENHALNSMAVGASSLVSNVPLMAAVYFLLSFYLYSATDRQRASRRARLEAIPLTVTLIVITVATIATPVGVRGRPYGSADLHVPQVAVFFIVAQLYLVYALATTASWTGRGARLAQRPATIGLWLTAGSLTGMAAANALRTAMDLISWNGAAVPAVLNQSAAMLYALAVPAFVVGLSYPAVMMRVAGLRIWLQHRRTYQQLGPLWELLHEAFPQDALHRAPTAGTLREVLCIRGVHRRYYRRVIECRDGLVRVSPYLAQQGVQDGATPQALANRLPPALRAQATGEPASCQALAVALPREDSIDADAQQLVALSDALGTC
ncbi:type IV secretory pathway VirB3-like protein [Streptacidiphilus sp. BW17]|uniref:MAB_1171c family putative transporter n=1 Tax=Streptacidiphilus sp. BW17 TaxID=3156274 RepID=UPI003512A8B8